MEIAGSSPWVLFRFFLPFSLGAGRGRPKFRILSPRSGREVIGRRWEAYREDPCDKDACRCIGEGRWPGLKAPEVDAVGARADELLALCWDWKEKRWPGCVLVVSIESVAPVFVSPVGNTDDVNVEPLRACTGSEGRPEACNTGVSDRVCNLGSCGLECGKWR